MKGAYEVLFVRSGGNAAASGIPASSCKFKSFQFPPSLDRLWIVVLSYTWYQVPAGIIRKNIIFEVTQSIYEYSYHKYNKHVTSPIPPFMWSTIPCLPGSRALPVFFMKYLARTTIRIDLGDRGNHSLSCLLASLALPFCPLARTRSWRAHLVCCPKWSMWSPPTLPVLGTLAPEALA